MGTGSTKLKRARALFRAHGRLLLLGACLLLVGLLYGVSAERFKVFPAYQLRPAFVRLEALLGREPPQLRAAKRAEFHGVRALATALLPLRIETFNLTHEIKVELPAGAICPLGANILLLDRRGAPIRFDMVARKPARLDWPLLPNNYEAFLASPKGGFKNNFRVHGLVCIAEVDGTRVLAAHEVFDPETQQTHLAVSSLRIGHDLAPRDKGWVRLFATAALPGTGYAANGAGGRMAYDGKGRLYLTVGDYNLDGVLFPGEVAQDPKSDFGAVFRIDLGSGAARKITMGHRNPQGIAVLASGEVLLAEQGPKGGDELNRIDVGRNYGWPRVSYGTDYGSYDWRPSKEQGRHEGYEKPVFAFVPSPAITNLIEVRHFDQRWRDDLLFGSLKAATLFRLRYEDGRVRYSEPIWFGSRIRDLVETEDGRIVLWTDQGELIFLSVDAAALAANTRVREDVIEPGTVNCTSCHHQGVTSENDAAPSLSKIVGRPIASDSYAHYSEALKALGGEWTEERLRAFLLNPQDFAPGTTMVISDLTPAEVEKAIRYLKTLD